MGYDHAIAGVLLLATLVTTSPPLQSYESQVRTMKLVNGRWSRDPTLRDELLSKQDLVTAILNDVTKPVYFPKGKKNIVFVVDPQVHYKDLKFSEFYLKNDVETYIHKLIENLSKNVNKVEVFTQSLVRPEDERTLMKLSRHQPFSIFLPEHAKIASTLIGVLLGFDSEERFISAAVYLRDRLNLELFVYSFSVAVLNHPEFRKVKLPQLINTMPRKFIDAVTFNDLNQQVDNQLQANVLDPIRVQIPVQYTATDREPEQKLAYFREDIEVNMHHWHWHLINPPSGPIDVVNKDRRGELFYHMHQQMVARYDFERLSNRMPRVLRLDVAESIPEGYFPKLAGPTGGGTWAGRPAGVTLQNLNMVSPNSGTANRVDIADLQRWENRIMDSIKQRLVTVVNGTLININNTAGIDILGNIVEASSLSPNRDYYGNLHNQGHDAISQSHDPDGRYMEPPGVMGDTATAVRDPIFFRWHAFINYIFDQHKQTLVPYTPDELRFEGVVIKSVQVQTIGTNSLNSLRTFWEDASVKLDLDFSLNNKMDIVADITRLQNMPFNYKIDVMNSGSQVRRGTVRIFLMPSFGEHGERYPINEQRGIAIEMDRFNIEIPPGEHSFTQDSRASSVTQPDIYLNEHSNASVNYCSCGWPQHLLVPKGNSQGLQSKVFVIVTDTAKEEIVDRAPVAESTCVSSSFCGVYGQKYPTKLPMGFPFDRRIRGDGIAYLEDFVKLYSNMVEQNVTIYFSPRKFMPARGCEEGIFPSSPSSQLFINPTAISDPSKLQSPSPIRFNEEGYYPHWSGTTSLDQFKRANENQTLKNACYGNRVAVVKNLVDSGENIDRQIDDQGQTCLHFATRLNYPELAKLLISRGSDVNARNRSLRTPLMNAIWARNLELAELLIEHNADLNAKDENGDTALMWARKKGVLTIVKFLESKGARQ